MRKTIGLFGAYWIRNYGDDLMALIFAKAFSEAGFEVCAYGMKGYEGAFGLRTTNSIAQLVEQSHYIVLGGGGFMVPRPVKPGPGYHRQMDIASKELAILAKERNIPFYALSVGGSGKGVHAHQIPPGWQFLLKSAKAITVRNEADIPLAREFCSNVFHFPDVVWLAPSISRQTLTPYKKENAVILQRATIELRDFRSLLRWIHRTPKFKIREWNLRREVSRLGFRATHVEPLIKEGRNGNLTDNMLDILDKLRSCRAIVSPTLHLGVSSLSFGNAFLSWHGNEKTRTFMSEVGIETFCGPDPRAVAEKLKSLEHNSTKLLLNRDQITEFQSGAQEHIKVFLEMINSDAYSSNKKLNGVQSD